MKSSFVCDLPLPSSTLSNNCRTVKLGMGLDIRQVSDISPADESHFGRGLVTATSHIPVVMSQHSLSNLLVNFH